MQKSVRKHNAKSWDKFAETLVVVVGACFVRARNGKNKKFLSRPAAKNPMNEVG